MAETYTKDDKVATKKKLQAHGYDIYDPRPNELMLDFDTVYHAPTAFEHLPAPELMKILYEQLGAVETARWASEHGGVHVVIKLDRDLQSAERIALQAALGSDPKRELLAVVNLVKPSFLKRPK